MAGKAIYASLQAVQRDLRAPKGQFNSFGKYKYRSCEDIVEAVKPLLIYNGLILTMSDDVVEIGDSYYKKDGDETIETHSKRVYIKATASVIDIATGDKIEVTAMAREPEEKKGMDSSQITGTASSYARKYALNGLFAIDDTKDADTNQYHEQTKGKKDESDIVMAKAVERLNGVIKGKGLSKNYLVSTAEKVIGKKSVADMTTEEVLKLAEVLEYEE